MKTRHLVYGALSTAIDLSGARQGRSSLAFMASGQATLVLFCKQFVISLFWIDIGTMAFIVLWLTFCRLNLCGQKKDSFLPDSFLRRAKFWGENYAQNKWFIKQADFADEEPRAWLLTGASLKAHAVAMTRHPFIKIPSYFLWRCFYRRWHSES